MAIYHCSTKPLSRSSGRSSVAAAAYRSGARLVDERQGLEHDYTRRSGVDHSELILPDQARDWTRSELWNAAEEAEKRKDGRTAREWELALPDELNPDERRELAVSFAGDLADRFGCAVDVAVHAPDRGGDQRNWHAHLLATTRQVNNKGLAEKCNIELSDAKRLSMGLEPARKEIEQVREVWAGRVNEYLERAGQENRVDHRSLAVQREEAARQGLPEKVAELDREPQIKLGWKVVQMGRRGEPSDRAAQFHKGKADNAERQGAVVDISRFREQLAQREEKAKAAARQQELDRVESLFKGKSYDGINQMLQDWRSLAKQEVPDVRNAREIWENEPSNLESKAWRETSRSEEVKADQVRRTENRIEHWIEHHPIKAFLMRSGLKNRPPELQALDQELSQARRFLESTRQLLEKMEKNWNLKRPQYEQSLLKHGKEIEEARVNLKTIGRNPEHFKAFFDREGKAFKEKLQQRLELGRKAQEQRDREEKTRGREPDRDRGRGKGRDGGGWSR